MRHRAVLVATWAITRLAPANQREVLRGDLEEEYAQRANTFPASAALKWYLRQVCASAAPLLWLRLTGTAWVSTIGVALLAYLAVGVVETFVNLVTTSWSASATVAYNPLGMFITFPMVVLIGYFAALCRPGAAIVLAALMALSVTAMTLWANESLPAWYRIAYLFVGPAAIYMGSALRSRRVAG
jgi:hypothetical protein